MNIHAQALGRIKSKKKAKASRLNGKLGGRPITRNKNDGEDNGAVKPQKKFSTVSLKNNSKALE